MQPRAGHLGTRLQVLGVGLLGPGLPGWAAAREVLTGRTSWEPSPVTPPAPACLAPAERRRAGLVTRLAMAAAAEATAGLETSGLPSVFGSSNSDGAVVAAILEALAGPPPVQVSPTQFHNSVHNASAAYWGIGRADMSSSVTVACHDDTFAASLLHAAARAVREPVLLCVYDAPMPAPLNALRATEHAMAVALVLGLPAPGSFELRLVPAPAEDDVLPVSPSLQELAMANPVGRSLRLLELLARGEGGRAALPYFDGHLAIELC
ncbi:MAG: beta-ketoacyl synthase chain length factor [Geminicoccaceae bacterium]